MQAGKAIKGDQHMRTEEEVQSPEAHGESVQDLLRDRIIRVLKVYPKLSPSMLQISIGTSISSAIWRPIVEQMIDERILKRDYVQVPGRRTQSFTVISLNDKTVPATQLPNTKQPNT